LLLRVDVALVWLRLLYVRLRLLLLVYVCCCCWFVALLFYVGLVPLRCLLLFALFTHLQVNLRSGCHTRLRYAVVTATVVVGWFPRYGCWLRLLRYTVVGLVTRLVCCCYVPLRYVGYDVYVWFCYGCFAALVDCPVTCWLPGCLVYTVVIWFVALVFNVWLAFVTVWFTHVVVALR